MIYIYFGNKPAWIKQISVILDDMTVPVKKQVLCNRQTIKLHPLQWTHALQWRKYYAAHFGHLTKLYSNWACNPEVAGQASSC